MLQLMMDHALTRKVKKIVIWGESSVSLEYDMSRNSELSVSLSTSKKFSDSGLEALAIIILKILFLLIYIFNHIAPSL